MNLEWRSDDANSGWDVDEAPMASVVIPCFNSASTLVEQLESLARQVAETPLFEVIVVDNRSSDGLAGVVRAAGFHERLDLRIVPAWDAAGASYARNVGVRHARAPLLLFCDADDVVGSRFVQFGVLTLRTVPLFSATALPIVESSFPQSVESAWELLDEPEEWIAPSVSTETRAIPVLMGGGFGIRRDCYVRLGGFDQSLAAVGEDNDFGYRAVTAGLSIARSHCVKLAYRTSSDLTHRLETIKRESRSRALLVRRYGIDPSLVMRSWRWEPFRVALAALKSRILRSGPEVDRAIAERWAASVGFAQGMIEFGRGSRLPTPQVGYGLKDD